MKKNKIKILVVVGIWFSLFAMFVIIWLNEGIRRVPKEEKFISPVTEKLVEEKMPVPPTIKKTVEEKKIQITVAVPSREKKEVKKPCVAVPLAEPAAGKEEQEVAPEKGKEKILEDKERIIGFLTSGKEYYEKGDYEKAIEEYKKILSIDSKHREASRLIREAEEKSRKFALIQKIKVGETEKSILAEEEKAKKATSDRKEKAKKYFLSGKCYYEKGEHQRADQEFRRALNLDPSYSSAIAYWVETYYAQKKEKERKEKEKELQEKAQTRENEIKRLSALGGSYYKSGKYEEALCEFEKILSLNPEHRLAKQYITISQEKLVQRQKAYLKAKQEAEKAAISETVASFYIEGVQNYKEGNLVQAERAFQKILILSPGSSEGKESIQYLAKIQKIENENKREKMREEKEREREEREFKIADHLAKGKNYYKTNQYTEAIVEFKKVLEQDSSQREAREYLTEAEYQSGRIKAALEQAEKQLKLKNYQVTLMETEKILKIKPDHERALELQRTIPQALKDMEDCFERARGLYRNSKYEEALVLFETVLEFEPTHSGALHYAQITRDNLEIARRARMEVVREAREKRNKEGLGRARRCLRRKDYRLALSEVEKILKQDPNCEEAQILYEQLYKESGDIESQLIDLGYEEIPWAFKEYEKLAPPKDR